MSNTPHYELAVSSEARDREDPDFDFLARQPGFQRRLCNAVWVFRSAVAVVLFILLILLIVDLSRGHDETGELELSSVECFFPLGGGKTETGTAVPQTQVTSPKCISLFKEYFKPDGQYWQDTQTAIDSASHVLEMEGNYSQMVVLDIDETSLSNLPVYLDNDFSPTDEQRGGWFDSAACPAIPATLEFYMALREKGFSVAFVTGRREQGRDTTEQNLELAGYGRQCRRNPAPVGSICYFELILREDGDSRDATVYKSAARRKLQRKGFELMADVGDQWSDLLGSNRPLTLVKMPNPLYYLP